MMRRTYSIMQLPTGWRATDEWHVTASNGWHSVHGCKSSADHEAIAFEARGFKKMKTQSNVEKSDD